ncbi:type IV pilus assembly protein PilM [Anaerohalosphaera lusitana]|uniref:Type IV pilus assembly protein PilM n=1 Tax=Anaerohalosphaera lusitana TaxID=1936003 RepID=A0A1U9NLT9_9BACT|nr:pilus assembly protein PilM [Anaerohalosphaera lusitana]AQT68901.1 type IV pilus assembly protein PilM [Anaerohalosphaera lusitana]
MVSLFRKKAFPIGLDIGSSSIKMIQIGGCGSGERIIAAEQVDLTPDIRNDNELKRDFAVCAIKEMLSRGGFQGKDVISCLPNGSVKNKSMRVTIGEDDETDDINRQLAARLGLDADKDEIRHLLAGRVMQGDDVKSEVICFGVGKETIDSHIDLLEESGLVPVGLDAVPCSILRSVRRSLRRQADREKNRFYIDLGSKYTTVIAGGENGLSFIKQIPMGGNLLNEAVSRCLEVDINRSIELRRKLQCGNDSINSSTRRALIDAMRDVNEELAREISMCMRYYAVTFRGHSPDEALLSGGEAYEQTLVNALKRRLGVDVEVAHPLRGFDIEKTDLTMSGDGSMCEWAVAIGAGIKGRDSLAIGSQKYARN